MADTLIERLRMWGRYSSTPMPHEAQKVCTEAANRIKELEAENSTLAAGVCEHRGGDDHGNPLCLKTNQPI